ncbi:hypothetical protein PVAP13_9NG682000 [Panicum virgatum]|uniref:Uncharacterized protein n=1 Tax=Panicum virgatum TaxID=38727 RepID=A0A8T0MZ93_PANVG|nr:hypothetical protein PVAP13_9NG682000 [Panicum virgatum]
MHATYRHCLGKTINRPHHTDDKTITCHCSISQTRSGRGRGSAGPTSGRRLVSHRLVARACLGGWELLACLGLGVGGWDWEDAPAALGAGRMEEPGAWRPGASTWPVAAGAGIRAGVAEWVENGNN